MRSGFATLLNFTCKFGEKDLLDFANDVVVPAFLSGNIRSYGKTKFLFIHTSIVELPSIDGTDAEKAIIGEFVKDTTLSRTQVLNDELELIENKQSMASSPSSIFVLFLRDHRLAYYAKSAHAPDYKAFATTAEWMIRQKRNSIVRSMYDEAKARKNPIKLKDIEEYLPRPKVIVNPIPTQTPINDFVDEYKTLQSVRFKVHRSNSEIDPDETWKAIEATLVNELEGETTIESKNSEGLNKAQAKKVIKSGMNNGVNDVVTNGLDYDDQSLRGTNDDMKLNIKMDAKPPTMLGTAKKLKSMFSSTVFRTKNIPASIADKLGNVRIDRDE